MSTLHSINLPPSSKSDWETLINGLNDTDDVILIEDACYATTDLSLVNRILERIPQIYTLESDTLSRGLEPPLNKQVILCNYEMFVQLSCEHTKVISWTR